MSKCQHCGKDCGHSDIVVMLPNIQGAAQHIRDAKQATTKEEANRLLDKALQLLLEKA